MTPRLDVIEPIIKPLIRPLLKPVVEPVLSGLDRHEQLLDDLKAALDVQFKRTPAIQAQLDQLLATMPKRRAWRSPPVSAPANSSGVLGRD